MSDPKKTIVEPHVYWGRTARAPAHQSTRVLVDSGAGSMGSVNYVAEASDQREISRVLDKATHIPIEGTHAA